MASIIIVGVLDNPYSSNIWMARSFNRLGHTVIPINYRAIIQRYGMDSLSSIILKCIEENNSALTIFCKCNGIDPKVTEMVSKKIRSFLWFPDCYEIAKMCPEIILHSKNVHYTSCTSEITVDFFKRMGTNSCYQIIEGIDIDIHKPTEFKEEYRADISFIGTQTVERFKYKKILDNAGYNVKFYGDGWPLLPKHGKDWADVCSSSTRMLSLNTFNNIPGYFSGRLCEALACGAATFHLDATHTLNQFFEDGKEVIYFDNEKDLLNKVMSITLSDLYSIAQAGRKKVIENYTMDHAVQKILQIVGI